MSGDLLDPQSTALEPVRRESTPTALERLLGDVQALKEIPVETVTELHRIHRIEVEDQRKVAFHAAFGRVQSRMYPVHKAATGDRGSKYAKAEAVCKMLDPLLVEEGFAWSFSDLDSPHPGCKRVTMTLRCGGHEEQHYYDAPLWDGRGPKGGAVMTPLQASGAIESYAQRRLRSGVFGVNLVDDMDGADPASTETISADQVADLRATIEEVGSDERRLMAHYGVERLEDLTVANLRDAHHALEQRRRRMSAGGVRCVILPVKVAVCAAVAGLAWLAGADDPRLIGLMLFVGWSLVDAGRGWDARALEQRRRMRR